MKFSPKLLLFLAIIAAVIGSVLIYLRFTQQENLKVVFSDREEQRKDVVSSILELKGKSLATLANDYTYWDEMVEFVANGDKIWAEENLDSALETYEVDAIWVYNLDNNLVYSVVNKGEELVKNEEIYLPKEELVNLFVEDKLIHFFIKAESGFLEFRGASIHPTADPERATPPKGYFFTARFLDQAYLEDLSNITNSSIQLEDRQENSNPSETQDLASGSLTFFLPLEDQHGQTIGFYRVDNEFLAVSEMARSNNLNYLIVVLLTALVSFSLIAILFLTEKDRKRAGDLAEKTRALTQEQTKLQASINSLNVGFIVTDTKFNIVNINSTAKRLLCLAERSNSARPGILVDPLAINQECTIGDISSQLKDNFDFHGNLEKCLKENRLIDVGEIEFRNLFLHIFMSPIVMFENSKLKVIGIVIVVDDTTQKTVLERAKDEFFSIASHELRTPLTSIRGNTSLIQNYYQKLLQDDKNLDEMVSDIHESSVRLIQIVNDFLDTSRLQQGRMEFKKTDFDFEVLAKEVVKELDGIAKEKNLKLTIEKDKEIKQVTADYPRVKQVLINLVGNSLKFTEKGEVKINLRQADPFLRVSVSDTGRGIDPKNQKLLFKKFQQAGSSLYTRDTTKGTGLGLYISKLIIEAMGGSITLEKSAPGQGTTFSFTLPYLGTVDKVKVFTKRID